MKKCSTCEQEKELSEFYNNKAYKDGKSYICKTCYLTLIKTKYANKTRAYKKIYFAKYSKINKDKLKQYHINYYEKNKAKYIERDNRRRALGLTREYQNEYKKSLAYKAKQGYKDKARKLLRNFIKNNNLIKQPCQLCGQLKTHLHHIDYNKPLIAYCLCPLCHKKAHKNSLELINIKPIDYTTMLNNN